MERSFWNLRLTVSSLCLVWGGVAAWASAYPPGYPLERSCQVNGPVEICATNQHMGLYPRFEVIYRGYLMQSAWGRISVFVKFNGKTGMFKMVNRDYAERRKIGEPITYLCYTRDSNQPYDPSLPTGEEADYRWCEYTYTPGGGVQTWEVKIPQDERDLLFYARDQYGNANAWDIEVAFVSEDGRWDSLFGQNYKFRFE